VKATLLKVGQSMGAWKSPSSNPRILAGTNEVVTKDDFEKKLSSVNQLMMS
jgi:hypothetical protein